MFTHLLMISDVICFFFFFQAEDGIRDLTVTGVQTCALPISCDDLTHNIATRLNQSFITPFDREDIYMMSKALDDVVDLIDGAALAVVMYDIHESTGPAKQMAGPIQSIALQLHEVGSMLEKTKGVAERLGELHRP